MQEITISDAAAKRIDQLLAKEPAGNVFRVSVLGGGCSGFQYKFEFGAAASDDLVFGAVHIDPVSIGLLADSQLDFVSELGAQYFAMKNPNASSTCGCGTSFAI
jgi:iron-sulfur cluster assembly accessory protein